MTIRIQLADDHETLRDGLRLLIEAQPDMTVVGEAGDGRGTIEQARACHPDVLILDLTMPGLGGLAAARTIHAELPDVAIVVLTRHSDAAYMKEARGVGAVGYVLKQSRSAELLAAVRAAARGHQWFDPAITAPAADYEGPGPLPITSREAEVLRRTAIGESNKEIAAAMNISVKTVEVHKTNAMRKLGFHGRADIVRYAVVQGWLRDP